MSFIDQMLPIEHDDPINAKILAVSEDKIEGFVREPFLEIAWRSDLPADVVMARIEAMLRAGTIRRVRQTLLATNLADGALVAWKVPPEKIDAAFDWMFQSDPFSGHVVLRSTETATAGSDYKLWTTVKVPYGHSLQEHCELVGRKVGAERFRIMPAKGIFTLGVGHVRRKTIEPGSKADKPAQILPVHAVELTARDWEVLLALKREFDPAEIRETPWASRAARSGSFARGVLWRGGGVECAKGHRAILDLSRTCKTVGHRSPGHPLQWSLPLGRSARPRNRSGRRNWASPYPDALLLA